MADADIENTELIEIVKTPSIPISPKEPSVRSQNASPRRQSPPKSPQSPPKSPQSPPKSLQSPPKTPQSLPKSPLSPPKSPQSPPKLLQSPPKSPQSPPKPLQSPPQPLQSSPKPLQSPPKTMQSPPKSLQSPPKSPQSLPKSPLPLPPTSQNQSARPSVNSNRSAKSPSAKLSPTTLRSPKSPKSIRSYQNEDVAIDLVATLEPLVENLTDHAKEVSKIFETPSPNMGNIEKIATMSKQLTNEANALRNSIKTLSLDIELTKKRISRQDEEDINFPYHLFLIEIVVNKIVTKCECFDIDYHNLVISASFLGKPHIVLYDPSYGKIENFNRLNVGKSTLFAMTYDKICGIKEFEIVLQLTKQPPCSSCVTKIGETRMDYTQDFISLRKELCAKWCNNQPKDDIQCKTAMPLSKNMYYLSCGDSNDHEPIGVIEVSVRMSFLGKEITTAFCGSSKPQSPSFLLKENNGMAMYSCQKVEMDDQGKILLDEDVMTKKRSNNVSSTYSPMARSVSPTSQHSSVLSKRSYEPAPYYQDGVPKYDEIFTKMNANELKIRVPKSTKVERSGKYDKIQELCSCESTPYNTGEQIQFELPTDQIDKGQTHTSNLKYTYTGAEVRTPKDRKIVNVTPTNCPVPVDMQKIVHPMKDVFILKIGKKLETKDKKTDLEIEFVTPKAPSEKPADNVHIAQQCSTSELKKVAPLKGKAGKGKKKKGKKGKEKKAAKGKGKGKKKK